MVLIFFFFNDTATTEIYTLSLHDALPILLAGEGAAVLDVRGGAVVVVREHGGGAVVQDRLELVEDQSQQWAQLQRSEEHTSELQSRQYLVCRLLLEKKKKIN